jgi:hypothetical protein
MEEKLSNLKSQTRTSPSSSLQRVFRHRMILQFYSINYLCTEMYGLAFLVKYTNPNDKNTLDSVLFGHKLRQVGVLFVFDHVCEDLSFFGA